MLTVVLDYCVAYLDWSICMASCGNLPSRAAAQRASLVDNNAKAHFQTNLSTCRAMSVIIIGQFITNHSVIAQSISTRGVGLVLDLTGLLFLGSLLGMSLVQPQGKIVLYLPSILSTTLVALFTATKFLSTESGFGKLISVAISPLFSMFLRLNPKGGKENPLHLAIVGKKNIPFALELNRLNPKLASLVDEKRYLPVRRALIIDDGLPISNLLLMVDASMVHL
ncbi:hypothetical protein TorRG33x02_159480 [Trema orientale]|uniref:Uncharacterized protein n=1 Tax=Trema orientale TaxID=63057 RepID=A0A2P5ES48_TREOI|nr:hypothetical protein TorRG33x02_159480 [Trema orientale]